MTKTENYIQVEISNAAQLRDWLSANLGQDQSIWLVTFKKDAAPEKYVSREEVLDELLSFGWIDGIRRKLDDTRTMQLISPRKVQHWAKSYKDRAAQLIDQGRMAEPGLKSIEDGKKSGLWNFMDDVDALIKPDDLVQALQSAIPAAENFEAYGDSYKRNILRWIKLAKTAPTRQKRIDEVVRTSRKSEKIPQM